MGAQDLVAGRREQRAPEAVDLVVVAGEDGVGGALRRGHGAVLPSAFGAPPRRGGEGERHEGHEAGEGDEEGVGESEAAGLEPVLERRDASEEERGRKEGERLPAREDDESEGQEAAPGGDPFDEGR